MLMELVWEEFMSSPASSRRKPLCFRVVRPSVRAWYLTNRLWEFHQIYNLGIHVACKGELITFWDQKVKGQGQSEIFGQGVPIDGSPSKNSYFVNILSNMRLLHYITLITPCFMD